MQVFICHKKPIDVAKTMYNDYRRYNKQMIECQQIINAIEGNKAWQNHPCTLMYQKHKEWLKLYFFCLRAYKNYRTSDYGIGADGLLQAAIEYSNNADKIRPDFITDELCDQHKRRLYTESPDKYPQFEIYGKSYENWYSINGNIIKYINGKRI